MSRVLLVIAAFFLSACTLLNDTRHLDSAQVVQPVPNRSIVIFGAGSFAAGTSPMLGFSLDEYSVEQQNITGNCWRYNRMQVAVPHNDKKIQYFAFDVVPGHYVFNGDGADALLYQGFSVPAGSVVYLGDFVYSKDKKLSLLRNGAAAIPTLKATFPKLDLEVVLADTIKAPFARFLCSP